MVYQFGPFELDTKKWELREDGKSVLIEPKSFALLVMLVENHDRVLSRDEIFDHIWSGVFVSEAALSTAIAQIRKALGDDGQAQRIVKTVRGRGFRFVSDVSEVPDAVLAQPISRESLYPSTPHPDHGPPVIAVLPFDLLGTDQAQGAIAEALPTELIATLAQLRSVKVIARASAFQFRGAVSFGEIRDKLGAAYVLTGSVELAAKRLAVIAELVDARTQQVVWSDAFNSVIDDIFELRSKIAQEIATVLEYRLAISETERLARVPSENLDAWGHYHRGIRAMFHYNKADNEAAGYHFARAAEIDPEFARAHAALSYTEFQSYFQQFGEAFGSHKARAMEHAQNAVRLDPLDPYCNLMLGRARWIEGDVTAGLASVDRSLALAPNYAFAFYNSALLNTILCDGERAEVHVASALARSPIDPHLQTMMGTRALAAYVRDDMATAVSYADQVMATPNAHVHVYLIAAGVHAVIGNEVKAKQALSEVHRRNLTLASSGFPKHFDLADASRKQHFFGALERLGA